jgi:hypothetical protein
MMLPKKKAQYYKKLIQAKLEEAGILDKTSTVISKTRQMANPQFDSTKPADNKMNPKIFLIPNYQNINTQKGIVRKLLEHGTESSIKQFLASDLSALKAPPKEEKVAGMAFTSFPNNENK